MLVGIFWGYVAMIEGLVARTRAEIGRPARVIATGGLAVLFDEHTQVFDAIEPDLTIQGLALLYKRTQHPSRTGRGTTRSVVEGVRHI
jgi:type III pantothenate kinase